MRQHRFECLGPLGPLGGEAFLRVLFQALDDDANGVLDHGEFQATVDSVD